MSFSNFASAIGKVGSTVFGIVGGAGAGGEEKAASFEVLPDSGAAMLDDGGAGQGDASSGASSPLYGYTLRNPAWLEDYDPVANELAVVQHGAARFSVLRDGLVRMEWSPHSPPVHYDTGSVFAVNRYAPDELVPAFSAEVSPDGAQLTLSTSRVRIEFDSSVDEGQGFTSANLRATVLSSGLNTQWAPGQAPSGSLHGTIRTLDRMKDSVPLSCSEQPFYMNDTHCEEGVASIDGWAVVDDSLGARWQSGSYGRFFVFTEVAPWPWVTGPAEPPPPPSPETCAADLSFSRRLECIWGNNVDEDACHAKGCCFDAVAAAEAGGQPPAMHFVPWCFWPSHPASLQARPGTSGGGAAGYQDLYLFASGHDFKNAVGDLAFVSGKVPLTPRYQLGPHFSRWYPYADFEERDITATYRRLGVPVDVQIVDTDWHSPYERGFPDPPEGVHVEPWTGYDFSPDVLPAPRRLVEHWHTRGVHTGFNLHLPPLVPRAGGVQYLDSAYATMASVTGQDPELREPVLGDYGNLTWVSAFLDVVIAPLMHSSSLDFWWLDWQQGEAPVSGPGLPVTLWLSYVFSSAPQLWPPVAKVICDASAGHTVGAFGRCSHGGSDFYAPRPTVMNRWGGLGSHRFPVGFSGDAETSWEMLRMQTYMTPTAANVLLQWSHDIGGFAGQPDGELMVRWSQFGVFSPILRPHCAGRGGASRDIWSHSWSPTLAALRSVFRLRAMLVPYLAMAQRIAYDTGVLPVHPV